MAEIDPSIALSYRPPNLATMPNLQVQTPLESLARVVSLRSMMQEGEMKGLQLQQLRTQIQEQKNLADLMRTVYGDPTGTGTPGAPIPPGTAPQTIIPGNVPGQAALAVPAGGAPVTPAGVDVTAGLDKYLTPTAVAPQTPAVAPAPQPTPVSASQFMAPQVGASGIPGWPSNLPTPAQIYRAAPTTGGAFIKSFTDQQKDLLDLYAKNQTIAKNKTEDFVRMANGMQDQDSFQHNLVDMARNGYITSDEARQYNALGFDDPKTQAWLYSTRMQAVSADKAQEMKLALIEDARKGAMFNEQYPAAREDRKQKAYTTASQSIGDLTDKKELPGWIANQDPAVLERYGKYLNSDLPLDQIKRIIQEGAGAGPKAAEAAATTTATEAAKYAEQVKQNEPTIQGLLNGTIQWADVPDSLKPALQAEVLRRQQQPAAQQTAPGVTPGASAPGAPAATQGPSLFGKPISDEERQHLSTLDTSIAMVEKLQKDLQNPYDRTFMGQPSAVLRYIPGVGTNLQKMAANYELVKQKLKGFATNKLLRGLTPDSLETIMPSVSSPPSVNDFKVQNLLTQLRAERDQTVKDLAGKVVPPGMTAPATAQPATAPTQQAPSGKPSAAGPAAARAPADVQDFLKDRPWGRYKLNDGRVFYKTKDGQIVPFQ